MLGALIKVYPLHGAYISVLGYVHTGPIILWEEMIICRRDGLVTITGHFETLWGQFP